MREIKDKASVVVQRLAQNIKTLQEYKADAEKENQQVVQELEAKLENLNVMESSPVSSVQSDANDAQMGFQFSYQWTD